MRGGRAPSENQVCLALHKERSPQGRRCRTKHHQPARRWLNGHVRALEHPAGCAAWVPALSAGPLLVAALLQGLRCCSGLRQCHPGHGSQQLLVGPIAQLAAHVALAAHAVCLLPLLLHPWTGGGVGGSRRGTAAILRGAQIILRRLLPQLSHNDPAVPPALHRLRGWCRWQAGAWQRF